MVWGSLACAPQPSSLRFRAGELQGLSARAAAAEAHGPWSPCSVSREASAPQLESRLCSAPLEKACVQPRRPGAAQINEFKKLETVTVPSSFCHPVFSQLGTVRDTNTATWGPEILKEVVGKGDLEIEGPLVKVSVRFVERHELKVVKVDHLVETWIHGHSWLCDLWIVTSQAFAPCFWKPWGSLRRNSGACLNHERNPEVLGLTSKGYRVATEEE